VCNFPREERDGLLERKKQKREERGCEWLRERERRRQGRRERDLEVGMSQSGEDRPRRKRSIVKLIGTRV